jgi:hypothetical protein
MHMPGIFQCGVDCWGYPSNRQPVHRVARQPTAADAWTGRHLPVWGWAYPAFALPPISDAIRPRVPTWRTSAETTMRFGGAASTQSPASAGLSKALYIQWHGPPLKGRLEPFHGPNSRVINRWCRFLSGGLSPRFQKIEDDGCHGVCRVWRENVPSKNVLARVPGPGEGNAFFREIPSWRRPRGRHRNSPPGLRVNRSPASEP